MNLIPTRVHAIFDYLGGVLLFLVPMYFTDAGSQVIGVPMVAGLMILTMALLTDYEYGLFGMIPMVGHLIADGLLGIFIIASPWIFGFAEAVWWPHVVLGAALVLSALMTQWHSHRPATLQDKDRMRGTPA